MSDVCPPSHHIPGTLRQTFATPSLAHICLVVRYLSHVGLRSSLSCLLQSVVDLVVDGDDSRPTMASTCVPSLHVKPRSGLKRHIGRVARSRSRSATRQESGSSDVAEPMRSELEARPRAMSMGSPAVAVMQVTGTGVPVPWEGECDAHSRRRVLARWGPALEAWETSFSGAHHNCVCGAENAQKERSCKLVYLAFCQNW